MVFASTMQAGIKVQGFIRFQQNSKSTHLRTMFKATLSTLLVAIAFSGVMAAPVAEVS